MSKTLIFLQENKIGSIEEMQERVDAATAHYHELGDSIKASEKRLAEIAVLKAHIINYAKTRPVYDAYRKSGYSKKFLEAHREQITLHKAAKAAFDETSLKKLPKVKELDAEYAALLSQKKAAYPVYRKARDEMQELKKAQKNVELFFAEKKKTPRKNIRPAKQKTPRILPIWGRVLGVLFRYRSIWHKCAACIRRMQYTKGLGLSQQAFCNAKMAFVYTNALLAE